VASFVLKVPIVPEVLEVLEVLEAQQLLKNAKKRGFYD
jgi:hypothetical protein